MVKYLVPYVWVQLEQGLDSRLPTCAGCPVMRMSRGRTMDDHEPNVSIRTKERLFSMRKGRTPRVKTDEVTEATEMV